MNVDVLVEATLTYVHDGCDFMQAVPLCGHHSKQHRESGQP